MRNPGYQLCRFGGRLVVQIEVDLVGGHFIVDYKS